MRNFKPARVVIEVNGVRASLIGCGRLKTSEEDFWVCKDRDIKEYLDDTTALLMYEGKLEFVPAVVGQDWALVAGKAVAEEVGGRVIVSEPSEYYGEPDSEPERRNVVDWF